VHQLFPFGEPALTRRFQGSLLAPFGNSESGYYTIDRAVPLAAALRLELLLYHTTWANPDIESLNPVDHMCEEAKVLLVYAQDLARQQKVPTRTVVELAPDVVEGLVRTALLQEVNLIVMAKDLNVLFGDYVSGVHARASVPLLVFGREGR
jgi:hypothetical protein